MGIIALYNLLTEARFCEFLVHSFCCIYLESLPLFGRGSKLKDSKIVSRCISVEIINLTIAKVTLGRFQAIGGRNLNLLEIENAKNRGTLEIVLTEGAAKTLVHQTCASNWGN